MQGEPKTPRAPKVPEAETKVVTSDRPRRRIHLQFAGLTRVDTTSHVAVALEKQRDASHDVHMVDDPKRPRAEQLIVGSPEVPMPDSGRAVGVHRRHTAALLTRTRRGECAARYTVPVRGAYYTEFGEAEDVLKVGDLDRPEPGPGEVRVSVELSAVNPTDWKARRGSRAMRFPYVVPHQDGAGIIDAVGAGVDERRIGQRVWVYFAAAGRQHGTAAEWSVVPAHQAVELPEGVSFELGACLGVPALTAHRCLYWDGPIEGCDVLVAGGAGAVGHFAIQLAKAGGARHVTATVSSDDKARLALAAGADATVDYRAPDAADQIRAHSPDGVHRIVEVALGHNIDLDTAVLADHGSVVSYATDGTEPTLTVRDLMFGNQTLRFMMLYDVDSQALERGVEEVTRCLSEGLLTPLSIHRYPLDEVVAAHRAVEAKAVGKVVIEL